MRNPAVVLALVAALTMVSAVVSRAADNKNVVTPAPSLPAPPTIDPATGLPILQPSAPWKDPNWKDPDQVLPDCSYDGLPLSEVSKDLRDRFKNAFDVLTPYEWRNPGDPSRSIDPIDPQSFLIRMRLKNVTASEVFNAMNLLFETENTPLRWELTMNGKRPTALLRVLSALVPVASVVPQPSPQEPQRMIYFVGELLADEKSGGMTMEQLIDTISEVYDMSDLSAGKTSPISSNLKFHKQAQLLIAKGTVDQIRLLEQIIAALKQKAQLASGGRRPGGGSLLRGLAGGGSSGQNGPEPKANAETKKTP